jgi:hypothetical protein
MKINKKLKTVIILSGIIVVNLIAGIILRNIFVHQLKREIQSRFEYRQLHLSVFPPGLVLEEAKTRSPLPFFSAEKISVKVSFRYLLAKERPFHLLIEKPVLKLSEDSLKREDAQGKFLLLLPISVEEGRVEGGEFSFEGKGVSFFSRGVDAFFVQKRNELSLRAEAEGVVFSPGGNFPQVEGKMSLSLSSRGEEVVIKDLKIDGADFSFSSEGNFNKPLDPEILLKTSFRVKAPFIVNFLSLPFDWEGEAEGEGTLNRDKEGVSFKAGFLSDSIVLNKIDMGRVEGKIDLNEKGGHAVEFRIQKKPLPPQLVKFYISGDKITGEVQAAFLDPVINYTPLPWPVASPVWGNFTIGRRGQLHAEGEFRDKSLTGGPGRYHFRGPFTFDWDGKTIFSFSSADLASSFARVEVKGRTNYPRDFDIDIRGEVSDLRQAREFTSLILHKSFIFPEIRGKGKAALHIFGEYDSPRVQATFSLSPAGFGKFEVDSVEGEAELINADFLGRFDVDDPFIQGKISVVSNPDGVKADIRLARGFAEKILPALDIVDFTLEGEGSGSFEVRQKKEDVYVKGSFSGGLYKFAGQNLSDVSAQLEWQAGTLRFPELQFRLHEGSIKGNALFEPLSQKFEMDFSGEGINLTSLYPNVKGMLAFNLKGKGNFPQDYATGPFEAKDIQYPPLPKNEAKGEAKFGYSDGKFTLDLDGNFLPGENKFLISFVVPAKEEIFSADIRGSFTNLNFLLPWKGAVGRVNYLAEIRGKKTAPQIKGAIDFQGPVFPLPWFAHAFQDYSGLMVIENNRVIFRSIQAKLGGGDVQGTGEVRLANGKVESLNLKFEGKNLLLSPLERTKALADGTLNFIKDPNRFVLEGDFTAQKLSWRREVDEKFVFYSSPYYESRKEPGFFDNLTLNVRLRADDNAWMENSLGRIRGRFDLMLTGSVASPVVMGDIEALDGNVYFQDRKFKVLRGRLSFFNPSTVEPYLSFRGETYVKDYRVTFSLEGLLSHLNPEFSSSPSLSSEDVLALLALGESFQRTYSYDTSTQSSTASLVSFQLSEEAKKRAEGLFVLDRFRIDPFVMGSSAEMAARLTVGKKISRNFFILYSTNLSGQREEIARLEWELADDLSVVGVRDEKGRFSLDIKVHKRF